jgi:hypothetical protein
MTGFVARHRGKLLTLAILLLLPFALHFAITWSAALDPPRVSVPADELLQPAPHARSLGKSSAIRRGTIWQVHLSGTPDEIGYAHARLLYDQMVQNEGILLGRFDELLAFRPARWLLLDLAQLRYRSIDEGMSSTRRREIAAGALGFQPDPYAGLFETYQRFVYLNALYDIALSFEHSPLIGCTTFAFSGAAAADKEPLLARAFDFEVDDVFDEQKAVFFVREEGAIPFASVAWPGLVGVLSGMNAEGLSVVVHGGRAGEPRTSGEPVVHALRRVLSTAKNTDEALAALARGEPMVSHIVIVMDAHGKGAVAERVPGRAHYAYRLGLRAVITNHFVGASGTDEKNERVMAETSSVPRLRRGKQLIERARRPVAIEDAVEILRDRRGLNDDRLELGDRSAIDALIATHGVVMNTATRTLWVSEAPHLLGRFVAFDVRRLLDADYDPLADAAEFANIAEDPLLTSGAYARWRSAHPE